MRRKAKDPRSILSLRLPRTFLEQIHECAEFSGRSVNAEMLHLMQLGLLAEARYREAAEKLLVGDGGEK